MMMKDYEKPVAVRQGDLAEGIYLASGDKEDKVCRFGRKEANPGSDVCQACSQSGGLVSKSESGAFKSDFKGCVDNMPVKEN